MPGNFTTIDIICPGCKEPQKGTLKGGLSREGYLTVRVEVDHKCPKPGGNTDTTP